MKEEETDMLSFVVVIPVVNKRNRKSRSGDIT